MKNRKNKIRADLENEIFELESALSNSYERLELVSEDGLIDFYVYQIKAYEAKHKYLLEQLKES